MKYITVIYIFLALLYSCFAYSISHNITVTKGLYNSYLSDGYFRSNYETPDAHDIRFRNISGISYTLGIKSIYIGISLQNPTYKTGASVSNDDEETLDAEVQMKNNYALILQYKFYENDVMLLLIGVSAGETFYDVNNTYNYIEVEHKVRREVDILKGNIVGDIATQCNVGYVGNYIYDESANISYIQGAGVICVSKVSSTINHDANEKHNFNSMSFVMSYNVTWLYKIANHINIGFDMAIIARNSINLADTFDSNRKLDYTFTTLGKKISLVMNISI